ncbi:MAG: M48 family metalloprotease [Maricaulaceae bacterium]|jgi:predicted Zn-dependent protease
MRLVRCAFAALACALLFASSALAQGRLRDEETERMLREFANPLLEAGGLNPDNISLYIIGDATMNAAAGGQNMFVNAGLITAAEAPIEIKGVMAHETGHIVLAHTARSGDMNRSAMGPFLVTMAAGLAAMAAGEGGAAAGLIASAQQFGTLGALTYSRDQEARTDQTGAQLLEATGQSSRGLLAFFQRFRGQELFDPRRADPYFRSHPLSSERVEALQEILAHDPYADAPDPPEHVAMLRRVQAKLHGYINDPAHTFRLYPETDTSTEGLYARAFAYYQQGNLPQAMAALDELLTREPDDPYFLETKGQFFYEFGRPELAIEPYERAVELLPDSALFRTGLAQSLIDLNDDERIDEALNHIIAALAIEPDNAYAWYQRSRIHERRSETALANLAIAEQSFYSGNFQRARQFAFRAREELADGSPEWIQATDILATSVPTEDDRRAPR